MVKRGFAPFGRLMGLVGAMLLLMAGEASAFDYARFQAADLDTIAATPAPAGPGVDVVPARSYRFDVTLAAEAMPCASGFLSRTMLTSGIAKELVDSVPVTHCVQVKSANGKLVSMFIQDVLVDVLAKEVQPGEKVTLYTTLVYFGEQGPGIVIDEFSGAKIPNPRVGDCGCGKELHPGLDYSAKVGTPVRVATDGVVVALEQDEQATVDTPSAGHCGRYVVVKHTYPNGRFFYTRYAQLGRLSGKDGKPLVIGQQVKRGQTIGYVGSVGLLHYEVRPADSATMDRSEKWSRLYGAEPTMDWSRYQPVDPQKFDADAFGKDDGNAANKT